MSQTHALIDALPPARAEMVSSFAHQLPVAIICGLFDIPVSDEQRFRRWVEAITGGGNPQDSEIAGLRLGSYLAEVALSRRGGHGTDILSGLVNDEGPDGRLSKTSIGPMAALLLVAGHETTVNLISNGILTLLRHPEEIARLRHDPVRAIAVVEELLRYDPPVQYLQNRIALTNVEVGGVTIPAGSTIILLLAAANRDARRFDCPTMFDPDRPANGHLGFGSGIHSCFGAPLARLEAQVALRLFFERIISPRLLAEPTYKPSSILRGPSHLLVGFDSISPRGRGT